MSVVAMLPYPSTIPASPFSPAANDDNVIRRVDPEVAVLARERTGAKRRHDDVELAADP